MKTKKYYQTNKQTNYLIIIIVNALYEIIKSYSNKMLPICHECSMSAS